MTHPTPEHRIRALETSLATLRSELLNVPQEIRKARWQGARLATAAICATAALAYALPAFAGVAFGGGLP